MKVVLFCGGLGTRLRSYSETVPKPMVNIGQRPILWHLMKYYAHFGHTDFILCLGYKGEVIKDYFLNYREWLSNDFVLSEGGREIHLLNRDIDDWKITFIDTGIKSNIGQRLKAVEHHLDGDEVFMANYADGLTDLWLPDYLDHFMTQDKIASFLAVRSTQSFHVVSVDDAGLVSSIEPFSDSKIWINGGFFVFRREIFDCLHEGEELVFEPFQRLIARQDLYAYQYQGFWMPMDTFKEKQVLDDLYEHGDPPWAVWRRPTPYSSTCRQTLAAPC
ncbi:MAG: sugar phosphate nucleotidyltransferase [Egibacteraceae bacterium]